MRVSVALVTAFVLSAPTLGFARPEAPSAPDLEIPAEIDAAMDSLTELAELLTDEQREGLNRVRARTVPEAWSQVDALLTPTQQTMFDDAVETLLEREEATPTGDGGWYLPYGCFMSSKVGLMFSVVGFIGCPGDTAREATNLAWGASIFSSSCLLSADESCDLAKGSAQISADLWYTLLTTCSVADTAYYSEVVTYRSCGGPRSGEPTPTPEPTPVPDPDPTPTAAPTPVAQ